MGSWNLQPMQKAATPCTHSPTHLVIVNKLVHTTGSQCCAHSVHDSHTRINVADQLRLALRGIRALFEQDNLWLLQSVRAAGVGSLNIWIWKAAPHQTAAPTIPKPGIIFQSIS